VFIVRFRSSFLDQPKLIMLERMTLNQGESLVLQCSIDSRPTCHRIRWFHNHQQLLTRSCSDGNRLTTIDEYRVDNVSRWHAGNYRCQVSNWLSNGTNDRYEAVSFASTDVSIQCRETNVCRQQSIDICQIIDLDSPVILNGNRKLAVIDNHEIRTECLVDANPLADITWFGPFEQRLSAFAEDIPLNRTVVSSVLRCKYRIDMICLLKSIII
jgi:hypothetical protein